MEKNDFVGDSAHTKTMRLSQNNIGKNMKRHTKLYIDFVENFVHKQTMSLPPNKTCEKQRTDTRNYTLILLKKLYTQNNVFTIKNIIWKKTTNGHTKLYIDLLKTLCTQDNVFITI